LISSVHVILLYCNPKFKYELFCAVSHRPKTNYYQYSLGILALCVSGVRVSTHVSHKLIHAVEHAQVKHGESLCVGEFESTLFFFAK